MNLRTDQIKESNRFRKDLGDLKPLMASIIEIGLLHPVVVDENYKLIAGARRLASFRQLGRTEIPVTVINIADALKGERDENVIRKDFTPTEAVSIWDAMEKANKWHQLSDSDGSERRERAAAVVGMSTDTLSKGKQVVESGQKELIAEMDRSGNVNRAYRALRKMKDEELVKTLPKVAINGKFRTIVIDPPWDYQNTDFLGRAKPLYSVMSLEDIAKLDMMQYADDETCHLYLWTTNAFIWEAYQLGLKWGFIYKTILTWVKPTIGLGTYFRNSTEHCLFFIKEGSKSTRAKDIPTHFAAKRGEHSEKPDDFYSIVERASWPPYLDFFARKERKGWVAFGNIG